MRPVGSQGGRDGLFTPVKIRYSRETSGEERRNMARRTAEVMHEKNPCMRCGACCIGYRASFYWAEGDDATEGGVPVHLTVRADAFRRAMRRDRRRRCVALRGTPGRRVFCAIYGRRPSVCRSFEAAWQTGSQDSRCNEARARLGLSPFDPFPGTSAAVAALPVKKMRRPRLAKSTTREGAVSQSMKKSR